MSAVISLQVGYVSIRVCTAPRMVPRRMARLRKDAMRVVHTLQTLMKPWKFLAVRFSAGPLVETREDTKGMISVSGPC